MGNIMETDTDTLEDIVKKAEAGEMVSSLVTHAMPDASEKEIDDAINAVYDAMEYGEEVK
jgi:hypothetical protein